MRRASGFTLIELVIVMIVISAGLAGLASLFSNTSTSLSTNETLQRATQYAQECAEKVSATRHSPSGGFASISNTICDTLPALPAGFTRSAVVTTISGTGIAPDPCPSGTNNCKSVLVTVTKGALSSSITVMLVDY